MIFSRTHGESGFLRFTGGDAALIVTAVRLL